MRRALIAALVLGLAVAWFGAVAGGAAAAGAVASWSERQAIPGLTERTIWGRDQVYVYRLPRNVTHTGDLHVELTYTPADRDCFVYLLGPVTKGSPEWQVCPGTYGQGFLSLRPGAKRSTTRCPPCSTRTRWTRACAATRTTWSCRRPTASRTSASPATCRARRRQRRHHLRGDLHARTSSGRRPGRTPPSAVAGAPYGGPFDFTPTSQGRVETRLQYPADPVRKTVAPASPALAACFEQYVYPPLWEPEDGAIPVSQPADYSHWDLFGLNRHAAAPLAGDDWYGLQGDFVVQAAGPWLPRQTYHYVPVLWLAAAQPYAAAPAQPGAPATGRQTVGYKATLLVPQNLRLAAASARVRRGRRAVLKGTLAAPVDATPGASVSWAPPGTLVTVRAQGRTRLGAGQVREDRRERRVARHRARPQRRPCGARSRRSRRAWPPSTRWSSARSSLADGERP